MSIPPRLARPRHQSFQSVIPARERSDREPEPVGSSSLDKPALRTDLKERRRLAFRQLPKAGEALAFRMPAELIELNPAIVAGYVPMRDEIEPGGVMSVFRQLGAQMALPAVLDKAGPLAFRAWDFGEPLVEGVWGTREPDPSTEVLSPDVVLVPLLGWSHGGGRIGYGAGFYDRTLAALRSEAQEKDGRVTAVGLGFEVQRVWDMPVEPHDQPLDWIVTESAAYRVKPTP